MLLCAEIDEWMYDVIAMEDNDEDGENDLQEETEAEAADADVDQLVAQAEKLNI